MENLRATGWEDCFCCNSLINNQKTAQRNYRLQLQAAQQLGKSTNANADANASDDDDEDK